ncbi:hypothetical protein BC834DRAFT_897448 [Gloeopeniophorella convolvens]|nr:hypothetical protein BC834DRAFT_897448 [Gloeopeniophorella convolvens]
MPHVLRVSGARPPLPSAFLVWFGAERMRGVRCVTPRCVALARWALLMRSRAAWAGVRAWRSSRQARARSRPYRTSATNLYSKTPCYAHAAALPARTAPRHLQVPVRMAPAHAHTRGGSARRAVRSKDGVHRADQGLRGELRECQSKCSHTSQASPGAPRAWLSAGSILAK